MISESIDFEMTLCYNVGNGTADPVRDVRSMTHIENGLSLHTQKGDQTVSYNPNYKDTYINLSGKTVYIDSKTVIKSDNPVIQKILLTLTDQTATSSVSSIRFLPLGEQQREKIYAAFGETRKETEEAYLLEIGTETISVYSNSMRGHLWGACTLREHYRNGIVEGLIYNVPMVEFRAMKLYLPAEDKLDEFYYMLDLFMHYGYNALVLEVGGAMEYKKHPEINAYWEESCKIFGEYSHKADDFQHSFPWSKNSIHIENGGGSYLSQQTVKEICAYARARGLEPIPEVPCLSHADYLIAGRSELAEFPYDPYPDVACPSNPKYYELLFEVLDEVIEVFEPRVVHIGHDEYYGLPVCEKCRKKRRAELYAEDVTKMHDYLAKRNIRTMMWAEKFLNSYSKTWHPAGGAYDAIVYEDSDRSVFFKGKEYKVQKRKHLTYAEAALLPKDARCAIYEELYPSISMVPKDIIAMNWYWSYYPIGDREYQYHGIPYVYGNFSGSTCDNWEGRVAAGVQGFAVSSWGASDFKQMQRGKRLCEAVYTARLAWSREYDENNRGEELAACASSVFDYRYRDALNGSYVDILHTAAFSIPHGYFGCGDLLNDDDFRLGYYHVYYKDGTDEKVEILWGENIGPDHIPAFSRLPAYYEGEPISEDFSCKETVFTCDFVDEGDTRYYRFVIPTDKAVERVEQELFEAYRDRVSVSHIRICNQ